jgi:hypothetical protein
VTQKQAKASARRPPASAETLTMLRRTLKASVILLLPVSHPPSLLQALRRSGPAVEWIAPSTPPPPSKDRFAALTMTSAAIWVMSPLMIELVRRCTGR